MSPAAPETDAIVVGSGPNGLAAAITLARAGLRVRLIEGADTPGGGCRTAELTLPGFRHDVCSAVHPLAASSPFFTSIDLAARGVTLCTPKVAFAHPLDGGRAAAVAGSVDETAASLGRDAGAYRRLLGPLVRDTGLTLPEILGPIRSLPRHPLAMARFGLEGLPPATVVARSFRTEEAQGLFAGVAAHSMLPLSAPVTSAFGLLLTMAAHTVGWPVVEGGSARLAGALLDELAGLGGEVETGRWVRSLDELPPARAVLLDVTPRQLIALAGDRLSGAHLAALRRFRYGPGVCKVDFALSGPVPWAAPACREAGTVHLGGTLAEVARSEADVAAGRMPERPYCLVAQPGVVDPTRAPEGQHTLWAYCHVPSGSPDGRLGPDRGPDRAVRARVPGPDPGQVGAHRHRHGALQPELRGRRHQRRGGHAAADRAPAHPAVEPVPDRHPRCVPVLQFHPARRRCARHVRPERRRGGPGRSLFMIGGQLTFHDPGQALRYHSST